MKILRDNISALLFLGFFFLCLAANAQENTDLRAWKSGIELGSGLSLTGYNVNLAYAGTFGNNVCFVGPKLVMSDANGLYDAPWGMHLGYRRLFPFSEKFNMFVSVEYQNIFFDKNRIHEFHFSYGAEYAFGDHWYLGNTVGAGGFIERFVDPFDGRVDRFNGYTGQVRFYLRYMVD